MAVAGLGLCWMAHAANNVPGESARSRLQELRKQRGRQANASADASGPSWATPDDVNYINQLLQEEWDALGFAVAETCGDNEFIRRASLDIIGRIPTLEETEAFLNDRSSDRREKLVNRLLASEEYGKNWANVWTKLMITDGRANGNNQDINPEALRSWLEKEFNRNTPWNEVVAELISASGRWDENGAVNFLIANIMNGNNTVNATSYMTRLFLCVQTQCTECHDHPWNEWKQQQFHGLNAFFIGTRERRVTRTLNSGQVATDYYTLEEVPYSQVTEKGTFFEKRNGLTVYTLPSYLDGRDINALRRGEGARTEDAQVADAGFSSSFVLDDELETESDEPIYLRKELAKVITADDNPYFARAIVNRLWYHYMGHSFIKNVDDFDNGQDEPTMPVLLDRLAEDFRAHGYDVKRLTRWICTSKAYSLSTKPRGKNTEDAIGFFTYMLCKPMTPEQLYDSVMTLTKVHKTSASADTSEARQRFLEEFRRTFGSTEIETTAPKYNGTITQSLMMMNSPLITQATTCAPGSFLYELMQNKSLKDGDRVDAIYMAALSRKPSGSERKAIESMFRNARSDEERMWALEDVLWAVLNTSEFLLNH